MSARFRDLGFAAVLLTLPAFARCEPPTDDIEAAVARMSRVTSFHRDFSASAPQVELGRRLFFDPRLSLNGKMSCSTCHMPSRNFGDGLPRAIGRTGKPVARNTPNLLNVKFHTRMFWDGRAANIDEASLIAVQNPDEMAQPLPGLVAKLSALPEYPAVFAAAYPGTGISSATIGRALSDFVLSVTSPEDSPFDQFLKDRTGLSPAALRGFWVFSTKAECIYCHSSRHLNYNDRYQNIGLAPAAIEDTGRYRVEPSPSLWGAFRAPSLRNVELTAPYMHDGRFATLKDVIEFYDRGGDKTRYQDSLIEPLHLTQGEKDDLLAFLLSLTSKVKPFENAGPR
jgi:cytochrome c peroxidase